jgi:hypothetical protein
MNKERRSARFGSLMSGASTSAAEKQPHPGPGTLLLVRADSIPKLTPKGSKVAASGATRPCSLR